MDSNLSEKVPAMRRVDMTTSNRNANASLASTVRACLQDAGITSEPTMFASVQEYVDAYDHVSLTPKQWWMLAKLCRIGTEGTRYDGSELQDYYELEFMGVAFQEGNRWYATSEGYLVYFARKRHASDGVE